MPAQAGMARRREALRKPAPDREHIGGINGYNIRLSGGQGLKRAAMIPTMAHSRCGQAPQRSPALRADFHV